MVENRALEEAFANLKANKVFLDTILTFYKLRAINTLTTSKDNVELFQAQGMMKIIRVFEDGLRTRD